MERLARDPQAFIRPSPSGGALGGVARRTREAGLLCEAAGFDVVVVETVGVGQSEIAVADMVDCFVLLAAPGGGDELQGIKRGIMELADVVVVNKADGDLLPAANRAVADYRHALHLLRPKHEGWEVPVLPTSALEGKGIDETWSAIERCVDHLRTTNALPALRSSQAVAWMWDEIRETLLTRFQTTVEVTQTENAVRAGTLSPTSAARKLLS
jgi:LAO/AO transport system kinase